MSASLVGSEMCIRDRDNCAKSGRHLRQTVFSRRGARNVDFTVSVRTSMPCLLYTSDAADDM
eukprot:8939031-Alexandrium_andersonii.AAC.1